MNTAFQFLIKSALGFFILGGAFAAPAPVSLDDMRTAIAKQSAVVVDIREHVEHATGVAQGAVLIPMSQLAKRLAELPKPDGKPLLVVCNTQNRSSKIVEQLQAAGYSNARYVQGGMNEWNTRKLPTVKPAQ
jgi:rhodanese-related sulfurtransferase